MSINESLKSKLSSLSVLVKVCRTSEVYYQHQQECAVLVRYIMSTGKSLQSGGGSLSVLATHTISINKYVQY